ncbi:hypothetical protein L3Y34_011290 [Caenorhabditis briggsae]|uniref:Uncharacterized protein n=1 Tax=Caenorhabditis briggsae TaxID=6238 RepID=A0AAE9CU97_CAEBR|nr:hypothetical protein L3Y34_011290 [Caenorhabditis briggsae]
MLLSSTSAHKGRPQRHTIVQPSELRPVEAIANLPELTSRNIADFIGNIDGTEESDEAALRFLATYGLVPNERECPECLNVLGYLDKKATPKPAQLLGHQQRLQILRSRPPNRRCYCDQLCQSRYRYKLEDTATGTNRILSFIFSQRSWGLSIELTMTRSLIKSTRMVISIRETGNKTPLNLILEISLDSRKLDLPGRPRWRRRKQDGKEQEKMDNNLNIMALPFNFSLDYPRCC